MINICRKIRRIKAYSYRTCRFFLCTTLGQKCPPPVLTSKFRKICVLLKNVKKLENFTLSLKIFWNFTLSFTMAKRTHQQIELREKKCCKIWFKLLEKLKKLSCQLKALSLLRRGVNRQLVPKGFSRYLPHKLTLTQGVSLPYFRGPVGISGICFFSNFVLDGYSKMVIFLGDLLQYF